MMIDEVDVSSDEQVRAFWQASRDGSAFERPYADFWSLRSATIAYRDPNNPFEPHPMAAIEGGEVVGTCQVSLPSKDNLHIAFVGGSVLPAHRRRGIGSALLEAALQLVRDRRRTTVISEADMPYADPPQSAGSHFLEHHGFSLASLDLHRVLDLPVAGDQLDELERSATPHHSDYRLVSFADRVPDEYLESYCALQIAFNDEAPLGELDLEAEVWDEERVRNNEERFRRQGRHARSTVAFAADADSGVGEMVALTEMMMSEDQPDVAWQSGTLVLPQHRGHRLGMAIKLANLRRFQSDFTSVQLIHSWNAEKNGPMVAINDALGFRPVEYLAEMQRVL